MLKKLLNSFYVKIAMFSTMIVLSGVELLDSVTELSSAHGVLLFAVFSLMRALSDLYHAAEVIES